MNVLPEKWAICWENKKKYQIINKWFDATFGNYNLLYHNEDVHSKAFVTNDGKYLGAKSLENIKKLGYEIITYNQFEKYILKNTEFEQEDLITKIL